MKVRCSEIMITGTRDDANAFDVEVENWPIWYVFPKNIGSPRQ